MDKEPTQDDVYAALAVLAADRRARAADRRAKEAAAAAAERVRLADPRPAGEIRAAAAVARAALKAAEDAKKAALRAAEAAAEKAERWERVLESMRRVGLPLSAEQQVDYEAARAAAAAHLEAQAAADKAVSAARAELATLQEALTVAEAREALQASPAFTDAAQVERLRSLIKAANRAALDRETIANGVWYDSRAGGRYPSHEDNERMDACSARERRAIAEIRQMGVDPDRLHLMLAIYDLRAS